MRLGNYLRENMIDNACTMVVDDLAMKERRVSTAVIFAEFINDVTMSMMASQITGVSIVYSTACSSADKRKHQSSASLAFVRGIHRWMVDSPHKGLVTRKMFPPGNKWLSSIFYLLPVSYTINSMSPGRCIKIVKRIDLNDNFCQHILHIFYEIDLPWMPVIYNQH